jgi:hypothetical protein
MSENNPVIGEATFDDEPVAEVETVAADMPEDLGDIDQYVEAQEEDLVAILEEDELSEEQRTAILNKYYPLPENFPSKDQLNAWEKEFGRIRIHRIAPGEAYVIRALTRSEFRKYLEILKKKFGIGESDAAEERMFQEELLVERCCLWPAVTGADIRGESKPLNKIGLAGTASILAFDVQEISNLIESNVGPFEEL